MSMISDQRRQEEEFALSAWMAPAEARVRQQALPAPRPEAAPERPAERPAERAPESPAYPERPERRGRSQSARHRHPRARAVLVALVVLLLLNGVVLLNRKTLDARSDTYEGLARVDACEALGRTPDVVYLGSSRTVYGIDPVVVDGTASVQTGQQVLSCNAGAIGSTFEQDYYTLKRLIDDGQTPKVAIETLWEWNLNTNASRTAESASDHFAQVENLAQLSDLPQLETRFGSGAGDRLAQTTQFLAQNLVPLYGDRIGILRTLCGPVLAGPCGENVSALDPQTETVYTLAHKQGWIPAPGGTLAQMTPSQVADHRAHDWSYMYGLLRNFQIGGIETTYLQKLLTLARAHHVQVALVASPLSQYFWGYFRGPTSWNSIMAYFQGIARQNGAAFYDESRASGYTDADFMDPQHLSPAGARQFSTWLAREVVTPMMGH